MNYRCFLSSSWLVIALAAASVSAQNIPQIKNGIIKALKRQEPNWKSVPSSEKRGPRSSIGDLSWKSKDESIEVTIFELESIEKAAEDIKGYTEEKISVSDLGDENYVTWGDPGLNTLLNFRRGKFLVFVNAMAPARIALRFAQTIDKQIQDAKLIDKWPPRETAVVEFQAEGFIGLHTLATPVDISEGVGAGGGGSGSGCETGSQCGSSYSYSLNVYKITAGEIFLNLSISLSILSKNESGQLIATETKNRNKSFSVSRRGTTIKNLGDGVRIKARIEKR